MEKKKKLENTLQKFIAREARAFKRELALKVEFRKWVEANCTGWNGAMRSPSINYRKTKNHVKFIFCQFDACTYIVFASELPNKFNDIYLRSFHGKN